MKYKAYFQLEIAHQYYTSGKTNLAIIPDGPTLKLMQSQQLATKITPKGLKVLMPVDEEGNMLPQISQDATFAFNVFPTSDSLSEYTDNTSIAEGSAMLFTNEGLPKGTTELAESSTPGGERMKGVPVMAKANVKMDVFGPVTRDTTPVFKAEIKVKSMKWRYYFLTDKDIEKFTIEVRNTPITFSRLAIPEDGTDQVAASLRSSFPDVAIAAFESDAPIAYSENPIKDIKLKHDENEVIKHLPNPIADNNGVQIIKII